VFGLALHAAGAIPVYRKNRKLAKKSVSQAERLLKKTVRSLLIFSEGSRTRDGRLGKFKTGGFIIPIRLGWPVVPLTILGAREALEADSINFKPNAKIKLIIAQPIATEGLTIDDKRWLSAECRQAILRNLELSKKAP